MVSLLTLNRVKGVLSYTRFKKAEVGGRLGTTRL